MKTIEKLVQERALARYNQLLQEGHDVVLPPEPLFPVSRSFAAQAGGNYPIEKAQIRHFVENVVGKFGIRQKVFFIVVDTGAKSLNKYIQRNFQDLGKDHTGENQPLDQHGHFSFCGSQILGFFDGNPLGAIAYPGLPADFWAWSGEKVLTKNGTGGFPGIQTGLEHALSVADKKKAEGYRVIVSCSWGGGGNHDGTRQVIKAFRDRGHFIFFAAGNSGETGILFPANIEPDAAGDLNFAIGAVDSSDVVAYFSSRGKELDFMSYGVSNLGCGPGVEDIRQGSGTSYATPFAVGCAGLLLATFPEIENMADLSYVLKNGITDAGPGGWDKDYGHGIIKMHQYADDDLPGDNPDDEPDEPDDNPDDTPTMPERELSLFLSGEFTVLWNTFERNYESKASLLDGLVINVAEDSSLAISASGTKERISALAWQKLELLEVNVVVKSSLRAEDAAEKMQAYAEKHWRGRGVLMNPPADFHLGAEWALYFFKLLAKREEGLEVVSVRAVAQDESGYQVYVRNKER